MNTTYFLNLVAGNVIGTQKNPVIPSAYYIGLSSTAPSLDGTGVTEPDGGGYRRVQLTNLGEPIDGVITNQLIVNFEESTAEWGTMTHYVIFDAAEGGNLLIYGPLPASRKVESATIMTIKRGALSLSFVNPTD